MKLFRAVPWILLLAISRILFNHYQDIDKERRRKAAEAIRRSHGRLDRFSKDERDNLVSIAQEVNHKKLLYDLGVVAAPFPTPKLFKEKKKSSRRSQ